MALKHELGNGGSVSPSRPLPAVRWLRRFLPLLFLTVVATLAARTLKELDLRALQTAIQALPWSDLLLVQGAALVAVLEMALYDWALCRWMEIPLTNKKLLRYSWVANTFNNLVSLSGLAGSGIRYLLLSQEGVAAKTAAVYAGIVMLSIPVGLAVLAWPLLLLAHATLLSLPLPAWLVYGAVGTFAAFVPVFLLITHPGRLQQRLLKLSIPFGVERRLMLLAVSVVDWVLAIATAWLCLRVSGAAIPPVLFLAAFVLAAALGTFSLMPGGLGVLDAALFVALSAAHPNSAAVAAGIILFRLVYFFVPWVIGVYIGTGLLTQGDRALLSRLAHRWEEHPLLAFLRLPLEALSSIGVRMLSYLTFLAGAGLLLSAAFPTLTDRVAFLRAYVPLAAVESSHLLAVATGVLLIALARGIADQVYSAYRLTCALLLAGAVFSLLKGVEFEQAAFLLFVVWMLWLRRRQFYRLAYPLFSLRSLYWLLALAGAVAGYALLGAALQSGVDLGNVHLFNVSYQLNAARFLRSLLVALLALLGLLGWVLFRMPGPALSLPGSAELAAARTFLEEYGGNRFSHLIFLGDKYPFYTANRKALIQFGQIRDRLVALGDPVGSRDGIERAVPEFRMFADRYDRVPVFYQVAEDYLNIYHDNGFSLFKLGEEAMVRIADFNLSGRRWQSLRHSLKRAERAALRAEVLDHPLAETTWHTLERISNEWLSEKNTAEKGFSLGSFDRTYLSASPIAVVREGERIVAFANLLPGYGARQEFSTDLIRHAADAPPGTMDFLMIELIEYARAHGYRYFNLGMAPLSGVGDTRYARPQEKLARLAYEYGNRLYAYKGLRSFKDKFNPEWRSTYLAYPYLTPLPGLLVDIAALIAGGYARILFKEKQTSADA